MDARRRSSRLVACAISDDVDAPWYAERKLLIGYSLVFLQIREGEGRIASLAVPRRQRPDLERGRIERYDQVFVFRFRAPRHQLEAGSAGRRGPGCPGWRSLGVGGGKVA